MADHFSAIAARYAAYRPHYPAELIELLGSGGVAWDVGCGNGQLAVALAERFDRVVATDLAQKQLDHAIPHARVEYRCAPAEASGLPPASVDLIVAAQAAHWFDWPRFVAEVARVARPGARAALVSYGNCEVPGDAGRALDHYHHVTVGSYWPAGREHVENGYRDLVWPWPAEPVPAIAMTAPWTSDELCGYVSSWSATQKLVEDRGPDAFVALCKELVRDWPARERREIRWPLTIKLCRLPLQ
jgi:SAM-dependent methyltransferase